MAETTRDPAQADHPLYVAVHGAGAPFGDVRTTAPGADPLPAPYVRAGTVDLAALRISLTPLAAYSLGALLDGHRAGPRVARDQQRALRSLCGRLTRDLIAMLDGAARQIAAAEVAGTDLVEGGGQHGE
jgi:hypothetical protein